MKSEIKCEKDEEETPRSSAPVPTSLIKPKQYFFATPSLNDLTTPRRSQKKELLNEYTDSKKKEVQCCKNKTIELCHKIEKLGLFDSEEELNKKLLIHDIQ